MNIIDDGKIEALLEALAQERGGGATEVGYLSQCMFKILDKLPELFEEVKIDPQGTPPSLTKGKLEKTGGPFVSFSAERLETNPDIREKINHVADWIVGASLGNEEWLNVKVKGTDLVMKLTNKAATLESALNCANKAMQQKPANLADFEKLLSSGAITIEETTPDGLMWAQLLTPEALDHEGAQMGHCIGGSSYDAKLKKKGFSFYSLRDQMGKAHVTLEVQDGVLIQCKGKENKPPTAKYMGAVQSFIVAHGWGITEAPKFCNLIKTTKGVFSILDLPDYYCRLNLDLSDCTQLSEFRNSLLVKGNLNLSGCINLRKFSNLRVGRGLNLSDCASLESLQNVTVDGDIILSGCTKLKEFPAIYLEDEPSEAGVWNGSVDLSGCTSLRILPKELNVRGTLDLTNCENLTSLPKKLSLGGDLIVKGCKNLTEWSKELEVGGKIITDTGTFSSVEDFRKSISNNKGDKTPKSSHGSRGYKNYEPLTATSADPLGQSEAQLPNNHKRLKAPVPAAL